MASRARRERVKELTRLGTELQSIGEILDTGDTQHAWDQAHIHSPLT
jgi:hypothetical protein